MSILVFALDGLDHEYVQHAELLQELEPSLLRNNLSGANGKYTYRIWPSIFAGVNGGESSDPYEAYDPDVPYIWDQYATTVLLAPVGHPPVLQYQDAFPEGYVESVGPQERTCEKFRQYGDGIEQALEAGRELIVVGSKLPDIMGHNDQNEERIHENIAELCHLTEQWAMDERVDDYLVVSDHGFDYESFGEKPSGLEAHSERAVLASSFADYDQMDVFIEEWRGDLVSALRDNQLEALGYKD